MMPGPQYEGQAPVPAPGPVTSPGAGPEAAVDAAGQADAALLAEQASQEGRQELEEQQVDDASAELAEVKRQRDEYLGAWQRSQAEFDNFRKRVERQRADIVDTAATDLVKKLLPVLDTADLALAHGGGEEIKQVAGALFDALSKEGLQRIVPEGQLFDPERHDAVAHEPSEGEGAPEVSDVLRAGYEWRGRVLRPAMVKVRG